MISPTVGRVVWYRPSENDNRVAMAVRPSEQPLAAIVAFVFDDRMVNLTVFDHDGNSYARTSVQLVQEGDEIPAGTSYAQWMPYQVGQAKKHDAPSAPAIDVNALEARLAEQIRVVFDNVHKHFSDLFRQHTEGQHERPPETEAQRCFAALIPPGINWRDLASDLEIEENYKLGVAALQSLSVTRIANRQAGAAA